jgi:hypothetical protein
MTSREIASDRWRTISIATDDNGLVMTSTQIVKLQKALGRIASRMVHGCVGAEEEASLAQLKDDLMLLIEDRLIEYAREVLEARDRQLASYTTAADRRLRLERSRPA